MSAVPVAIPLAWSSRCMFFLQSEGFGVGNGSDCLPQRRFLR
jgi:hypothetical protein